LSGERQAEAHRTEGLVSLSRRYPSQRPRDNVWKWRKRDLNANPVRADMTIITKHTHTHTAILAAGNTVITPAAAG